MIDEAKIREKMHGHGLIRSIDRLSTGPVRLQVRPWLSRKRQAFLEDALRLHRVKQVGGALELPLASLDDLVSAVVALSDRQTMKDLLLAA